MSPTAVLGGAAQLAIALVSGWVLSSLAVEALGRGRDDPRDQGIEWPERALLAVAGFVAWCALLMVAHIVTGGAVFGVPVVVPGALALLIWWGARRGVRPVRPPWVAVLAALVVLLFLYGAPAVAGGSALRTGDIPWHMGWTEQLLAGEPVPTGPSPSFGRNAYPWGFHAVLATLVRAVPGTDPGVALHALHVLLLAAIPLGGACLARLLRRDAGWPAAAATALVGGMGWIAARAAFFSSSPAQAPYGADLVVASPNAVYELLPPPLPRELGLVLLAAAGVALALAVQSASLRSALVAGAAVGLVGLVSVPMFASALLWSLLGVVVAPRGARLRLLAAIGAAALSVLALWAGPVIADFVRFGGFVDITPQLGREWPLPTALWAWGLLLPGAAAGVIVCLRSQRSPGAACLLLGTLGTTLLLALSIARGALDWDLAGNATLLHQGRVWPVAHLLAAALTGVAVAGGHAWLRRRSATLAAVSAAGFFAVGAVSPVLAAGGLARTMRQHDAGFIYGRDDFAGDAFVRRAAAHLDPDDVVRVEESRLLAFVLWQLSGVRLGSYDDPRLDGNDLRIRFRERAERWDERAAEGGFPADFLVAPEAEAPGRVLERGTFKGKRWMLVHVDEPRASAGD